jgi:Recombinase
LVDETGSPKAILEAGQRKFLATQHVKLVLGPDEEVRTVQQIYSMYLNENMTVSDITRYLTRKQVPREVPRPWNDIAVHRILSHAKYCGCIVFGRFSTKMRSDKCLRPRDEWVVQANSFEAIISPEVFEEVQKKRRNAVWLLTNEQVLERVRAFAEATGSVHHDTLTRGRGVPCYETLIRRFGTMRQVYDLIGMQFTRVFHVHGGSQKSRILRLKIGMDFEDSLRRVGIPFRRDGFVFTLNGCQPVHLQLAWCIGRTKRGDLRWKIHWSINSHNQPCLAARLTLDNTKILDWFLLMKAPHSQSNFRLSDRAIRGTQSARPSIADVLSIIQQRCALHSDD